MTQGVAANSPSTIGTGAVRRWTHQRVFFSGMAIAMALTALVGFAPTYFFRGLTDQPSLSPLLHLHGGLYTAWILLLVVQTNLAAAGRMRLHKALGKASGALIIAMFVSGYAVAVGTAAQWVSMPGQLVPGSLQFLIIPLGGLVVFATLVGFGLHLRQRPEFHRRLMLLATIELLNAAIDRLPGVYAAGLAPFYLGTDLFLLAIVTYDLVSLRRVHPATLWGGGFLVATQIARVTLADSAGWLAIAEWVLS
jgi:hypothetical protein